MIIDYMIFVEFILVVLLYAFLNGFIAFTKTASEMKSEFIDEKRIVGKIFSIVLYAPAWTLKGFKMLVNKCIA